MKLKDILKEDYPDISQLKSNIGTKWRNDVDMKEDLRRWVEAISFARGYDAADDIVSALEVEARYAKEYLRKNSRAIRNHPRGTYH